ncbi:major facilitator superfamily domain-containing protein [Pseudomassariella vexata]|uniref:Major facilitator superfamily domain-containing protein n=1 Tax=Pseudomassariella vexata TaxID=1141098 RepID=A0A1Y2E552_9PEZI|nr:major facilitator superfamily domain-containing protein [Pseudomassariella vexata]ORY66484.1 major facilitator superfamily domain-containing protein [Pseudomassariella vexata]
MERGDDAPNISSSDNNESANQPVAEFREGGYGWLVTPSIPVALLNAHTWGLNSSFAVFLAYYLRSGTFEGTSTIGYAFVGGLSLSIAMLISPLATYFAGSKWCGTRKTIFLGAVFETAGFVGASFTSQLWHLLLSQGVAFGVGMGFCFVASYPVPTQWFSKRRSLASACAAAGSGFGGFIYSLSTNAMIARIGLPRTFRALAILCFVVNGACSVLIRDRNKAIGSVTAAFNWRLFARPSYVLLEMWLFFSVMGYVILLFSIADYSQAVGLTTSQASLVGALFNLGQGLGRPMIGLSSDSVGRLNMSCLCTLLCSLLCFFFWIFAARSLAACIVLAFLSGTVAGVMWATAGPVCAEVVGLPLIPSALSMSWLVLVIPSTFSEVVGLSLRKETGYWGYLDVQIFVSCMYLVAFMALWMLRAWKVAELEEAGLDKEGRERAVMDDAAMPHESGVTTDVQVEGADLVRHRRRAMLRGLWAIERV